jgi:Tfp pilus assembly protein PilX
MNQTGQVAVVLLLFILVALTIGLTVTQRSLSSINTSSQSEQVSRAFTAAEAGLERSLNQTAVIGPSPAPGAQDLPLSGSGSLNNNSSTQVKVVTNLPRPTQALEYPPIGKDTFAQFWIADPSTLAASNLTGVNIYYGRAPLDTSDSTPALEVNVIARDATNTYSARRFYDSDSSRRSNNGFVAPTACGSFQIYTSNSAENAGSPPSDTNFYCHIDISFSSLSPDIPAGATTIMVRARILYSNIKQPLAVQPGPCTPVGCTPALPLQAAIYSSTGVAGQSQKTIQVFRQVNFMPPFLDFAIFSSGEINKTQ